MTYTRAAVERAMKVQEVILRALSGRQSWWQLCPQLYRPEHRASHCARDLRTQSSNQ
jgi:hypothetical protein